MDAAPPILAARSKSLVTVALLTVLLVATLAVFIVTMSVPTTTTTISSVSLTRVEVQVNVQIQPREGRLNEVNASSNQTLGCTVPTSYSSQVDLDISHSDSPIPVPPGWQPKAANSSRNLTSGCISIAVFACDNKGTDSCSWPLDRPAFQGCGFHAFRPSGFMLPTELPPAPLHHKNIVFHGDSTVREVFNAAGLGLFGYTLGVSKQDANMSSRAVLQRSSKVTGTTATFRFDYTFDHLEHPIANISQDVNRSVDAVVVGMGLYHARMLVSNVSIHIDLITGKPVHGDRPVVPFEYLQATAVKRVIHLVCDAYRAPVGYFLGTWMDCAHLKIRLRGPQRKPRPPHSHCTREHTWVQRVNSLLEEGLLRERMDNPRPDGCQVHYIPAIRCQATKHPCLPDMIHSRPNGLYAVAKSQVLINAMIATWRNTSVM